VTSERSRLLHRSLGFRLFALILVPVIFASGLLVDRLNRGFAQTKRVQQLDMLTRETLTSGRLQALLDLERSSVLGIVRGRALPGGLDGLKGLLGIDRLRHPAANLPTSSTNETIWLPATPRPTETTSAESTAR
jgi:hypothetical protein